MAPSMPRPWDYLNLAELLSSWMGPLRPVPSTPGAVTPRAGSLPRDLVPFLGAGFARSVVADHPLFNTFKLPVVAALARLGDPLVKEEQLWRSTSMPDLLERLEFFGSRRRVVETILAWPLPQVNRLEELPDHPVHARTLVDLAADPVWQRTWYPWKTLRECVAWIEEASPHHMDILHPCSPPVILARLMRERVFSRVVTTNWDAYVEIGAYLTGMYVLDPVEDAPPRTPMGERELLRVIESAQDYLTADLGPSLLQLHKVNGGVSSVLRLLTSDAPLAQIEEELRRRFMVTSSDLHEWEENRWALDLIHNTLRSGSVLLVGVSAEDAVTYHLLRLLQQERQRLTEARTGIGSGIEARPLPPLCQAPPLRHRVFALGHAARSLRLENVLRDPNGHEPIALARCQDGWTLWKLIYARALIQRILCRIEPLGPHNCWQAPLLEQMIEKLLEVLGREVQQGEVPRDHELRPWLELLTAAVPRWMTISRLAERFPALVAEGYVHLALPTFYLPFFDVGYELHEGIVDEARTRSLLLLASLLASLWEARDRIRLVVDGWTGLTTLLVDRPLHQLHLGGLLRLLQEKLSDPADPDAGEVGLTCWPVTLLPLFPTRSLSLGSIKAALQVLGDRRCRLRGGRGGGNMVICVVESESEPAWTLPGPARECARSSAPQQLLAEYLGLHLPLVTVTHAELRQQWPRSGRADPAAGHGEPSGRRL